MKRAISLLFVLAVCMVLFVGCGGNEANSTESHNSQLSNGDTSKNSDVASATDKENNNDETSSDINTESSNADSSSNAQTTQPTQLRTMTFNVRCAEFTEERIGLVLMMIDKYAPDTFGVQEATVEWMNTLKSCFEEKYDCVGVGRNANGTGEASAVFFLKSKFELLDGGTKWLTETPDVKGSKIQGSNYIRIFSFAKLKIKATGKTFMHINTHLDDSSDEIRTTQASYLLQFAEQYKKDMPCILSGDFNCTEKSNTYTYITSNELNDSLVMAKESEQGPTYHAYGKTQAVIDHIFVTNDVEVKKYKVCTETFENSDGGIAYPSDHNPVIIDYIIQ